MKLKNLIGLGKGKFSNLFNYKPQTLHISVTYRCNLACRHCDIWKTKITREELTLTQWREVISKLVKWLGPFRLDFVGGEPLLREDLMDLIEFCSSKDIYKLLNTNGFLIDKSLAERMAEAGLDTLNISLDGNERIHNYIRNNNLVYDKVMQALAYLNTPRRRIFITISTVIMGNNLDEIPKLANLVKDKKMADLINFQVLFQNFNAPYDPHWYRKSEFWPRNIDEVDSLLECLIQMKREKVPINNSIYHLELMKSYFRNPSQPPKQRCLTGSKNFIINAYGDVLLCWNMEPIGNILKSTPQEIWRSKEAELRRKQINGCRRNCNLLNCNYED